MNDRHDKAADIDSGFALAGRIVEEIITVAAVLKVAEISVAVIICIDF